MKAQHASVELLAAEHALVAGRQVWLGLRFVMEPGWHIYWVNPGDSGGPPTVKWSLPPGFSAGPFEWPAPERIGAPPIVNYGYHGTVTLPFQLSVPASGLPSTPVAIAGDLRYLICNDLCVPGRARLELTMSVRKGPAVEAGAGRAAIDAARARVPRAAPRSWKATASSEPDRFVLEIDTGRPEKGALFFPLEVSQVDDGAKPEVVPTARGVRFGLAKSAQLREIPPSLKGVVTLSSGQSFTVNAPIIGGSSR